VITHNVLVYIFAYGLFLTRPLPCFWQNIYTIGLLHLFLRAFCCTYVTLISPNILQISCVVPLHFVLVDLVLSCTCHKQQYLLCAGRRLCAANSFLSSVVDTTVLVALTVQEMIVKNSLPVSSKNVPVFCKSKMLKFTTTSTTILLL